MTGTPSPRDMAQPGGTGGGTAVAPARHRRGCRGEGVTTKCYCGRGAASVPPGGAAPEPHVPLPARSWHGQEEPRPERCQCRVLLEPALSKQPCGNSSTGCGMRLCCRMLDPVIAEHLGGAKQDPGAEGASGRIGARDGANSQRMTEKPKRVCENPPR